jgi:hypothetical protein
MSGFRPKNISNFTENINSFRDENRNIKGNPET